MTRYRRPLTSREKRIRASDRLGYTLIVFSVLLFAAWVWASAQVWMQCLAGQSPASLAVHQQGEHDMTTFYALIVRKELGEIIPRRAKDRANATGQWFKWMIPVWPARRTRKGSYASAYGFKTEALAIRAMDRVIRTHKIDGDTMRGLVWMAGHEDSPALTVAL